MFNRIRLSLTLWYVAVLLVIVLAMAGFTYGLMYRSLRSEVDDSLRNSARGIATQIDEQALNVAVGLSGPGGPSGTVTGDEDEHEESEEHLSFFSGGGGDTFYLVLSPEGQTLLNPLNVSLEGALDVAAARSAASGREAWTTVHGEDADYRLYSLPVMEHGQILAVVQVGRSLQQHQEQLRRLVLLLAVSGAGGLALAAAGGLWLAGRALRPVRESFDRQRAFVADASHELRTPLTLVRGNAEMLAMSPTAKLSGEDREYLEGIVRESEHIERLVADLATLARMDEGRLQLHMEPLDLTDLVQESGKDARLLASQRRLDIDVKTDGPLVVLGDAARLRQLLVALLDNAVRYTPDGGRILIETRRGDSHAEVRVSDTGPGIAPEHLARIFERFYRADPSRSRAKGGTGLGLAIARGIAEAHGGTLDAESEPGRGSTFIVTLPRLV